LNIYQPKTLIQIDRVSASSGKRKKAC
jgi:hypothetical protein